MMDVQIALMLDFQLKKKIFEEASNQDGGLSLDLLLKGYGKGKDA